MLHDPGGRLDEQQEYAVMAEQHDSARPSIRLVTDPQRGRVVNVGGPWILRELGPRLEEMRGRLGQLESPASLTWDLTAITTLDSAGALLLWQTWGDTEPSQLVVRPDQKPLFARLTGLTERAPKPARQNPLDFIAGIGDLLWRGSGHVRDVTILVGQIVLDLLFLITRPHRVPWREISATIYKTGGRALSITGLVGLLIGIVISYLSALQLRLLGGEAFIVDLMGLAVTRELGPLLAAILIAGRSGSAMTAELGVMRLTQELDALQAMGISTSLRIVLPKVIALAIAMPLLVLWTNAAAIFGGMLVAQSELDIKFGQFLLNLPAAVPVGTYWLGIGKAAVFGMLIALVACYFGLRIQPNTESLGRETTNAVVTAITMVILADAVFAVALRDVGWYD